MNILFTFLRYVSICWMWFLWSTDVLFLKNRNSLFILFVHINQIWYENLDLEFPLFGKFIWLITWYFYLKMVFHIVHNICWISFGNSFFLEFIPIIQLSNYWHTVLILTNFFNFCMISTFPLILNSDSAN